MFINFFCGPCALLLRFTVRGQYTLFISVIHPWGFFLKRSIFPHGCHQKSDFNLSTLRNKFQQSLLLKFHHALKNFIELLFAALVQFYSVLVEESKIICSSQRFINGGDFKKKQFFHRWDQKVGFNLSTLMNRFQHLLLLKFPHALKIFIKILFAVLVHFYYVLLRDSKIFCSSQWFIHEGFLKSSKFCTDETKKLVLICLRLETGSNIFYVWSFTMHSISSSNLFLRPWCTSTPL